MGCPASLPGAPPAAHHRQTSPTTVVNMRFSCSLSRQQAAVALIVGRRFASAFVAAPRGGVLAGSTALPMRAQPCNRYAVCTSVG